MEKNHQIASSLRMLRAHKGLTQEQLASQIHVSRSAYCQYEKGLRTPDYRTLVSIANFYSVSVDSMIAGLSAFT